MATETTEYAILLPGDETHWEQASTAERAATYERHGRFMELLGERGHTVTGGAELTHSRTAKTVRGDLDAVTVTDGPYAESVEQLTGFYLVRTHDLDDLLQVVGLIAESDGAEVRACVADSDPNGPTEGRA